MLIMFQIIVKNGLSHEFTMFLFNRSVAEISLVDVQCSPGGGGGWAHFVVFELFSPHGFC